MADARGARAAAAARAAEAAPEPRGVRARMAWLRGLRYLDLALDAIAGVAADADVSSPTRCSTAGCGAPWPRAAASRTAPRA